MRDPVTRSALPKLSRCVARLRIGLGRLKKLARSSAADWETGRVRRATQMVEEFVLAAETRERERDETKPPLWME